MYMAGALSTIFVDVLCLQTTCIGESRKKLLVNSAKDGAKGTSLLNTFFRFGTKNKTHEKEDSSKSFVKFNGVIDQFVMFDPSDVTLLMMPCKITAYVSMD